MCGLVIENGSLPGLWHMAPCYSGISGKTKPIKALLFVWLWQLTSRTFYSQQWRSWEAKDLRAGIPNGVRYSIVIGGRLMLPFKQEGSYSFLLNSLVLFKPSNDWADAHSRGRAWSALFSPLIQVENTSRIMFSQMPGHPMAQSSWYIPFQVDTLTITKV